MSFACQWINGAAMAACSQSQVEHIPKFLYYDALMINFSDISNSLSDSSLVERSIKMYEYISWCTVTIFQSYFWLLSFAAGEPYHRLQGGALPLDPAVWFLS